MRNKLKLHQLYSQVVREQLPYSCLSEWADRQILAGDTDDAIICLSLADGRERALAAVSNILGTDILLQEPALLPEMSVFSQAGVLGVYEQCIEYQAGNVLIWCPHAPGQPVPERIGPEWMRQIQTICAAADEIKQSLFQYCARAFPDVWSAYRQAGCEDYVWQVAGIRLNAGEGKIFLTVMANLDFAAEDYDLPDCSVSTLYIDLRDESDKIAISKINS
ncbi:hypothetical protein [Eikenella sp. Marseille-P7795]|uniref:hypothetical protein n=1 Tax=Eikenella sp. Marseille-P7795 TaxID=2866577 RepID=UPI001CE44EFD|nr:hypothetical protein [Eikenella sp. Marseille-P7795]